MGGKWWQDAIVVTAPPQSVDVPCAVGGVPSLLCGCHRGEPQCHLIQPPESSERLLRAVLCLQDPGRTQHTCSPVLLAPSILPTLTRLPGTGLALQGPVPDK